MAKRIPLTPVPGIVVGELHVAEDDGVVRVWLTGDWDEALNGRAVGR